MSATAPRQLGLGSPASTVSNRPPADTGPVSVVYIEGAARSGSTLLARMTGAQPGFMTVGEAVLIWRFGVLGDGACSCGRNFSSCDFWKHVADSAPGLFERKKSQRYVEFLNTTVLRTRNLPRLWTKAGRRDVARSIPAGLTEDLGRLYGALREVTGARVVVDASKFAAYRFILDLVGGLDVTTIHLIRDPRAVAYSWHRSSTPDVRAPEHESSTFLDRSAFVAGLDWLLQNHSTDVVNDTNTADHFRLRYEDLITRPNQTIREIVAAMSMSDGGVDRVREESVELPEVHIFGNPGRFSVGAVPVRLDDEWQRQMPFRTRACVTGVASPLLTRYGYRRRR
jgi:hypothetical protein